MLGQRGQSLPRIPHRLLGRVVCHQLQLGQYMQSEFVLPDVDQNVMNIPGMVGLLEDLQQYSGNCLDSIDERLAVAEGLLAMGWSKSSPMRGLPE